MDSGSQKKQNSFLSKLKELQKPGNRLSAMEEVREENT
jgi:hypothetical protein